MNFHNIKYEIQKNICLITLNRPDKLNALNQLTLQELYEAFTEAAENDAIKGVLLTGSGEKAFAAGADISEIQDLELSEGKNFSRFGQEVFSYIEHMTKPVIALVNGFALGGGCELALACHLRIASENAKFGQPEVNLGLIPGYGGTQRLPRLIGRGPALELLLTANLISAQRAYELGLVNKISTNEELAKTGKEFLETILSKGPLAIKYVLESVQRGMDLNLEQGLKLEADYFGYTCNSNDMKEGTSAFLEKREPQFKGK